MVHIGFDSEKRFSESLSGGLSGDCAAEKTLRGITGQDFLWIQNWFRTRKQRVDVSWRFSQ